MFIFLYCLLLKCVQPQIYNLERQINDCLSISGYYYGTKYFLHSLNGYHQNPHNYGFENFGDLSSTQFTLSFFVNINQVSAATQSYIMSIHTGQIFELGLTCTISGTDIKFQVYIFGTLLQSLQFSTTNWYQIIVFNTGIYFIILGIQICNYILCQSANVILQLAQNTRINLFQDKWFIFWQGHGYGVTLYKGFNSSNFYILQNSMQPEAIIDINVQEKVQSKLTVDYSEYESIVKLGQYFNLDERDPQLIQKSLLFKNQQFIYIKDPILKETFTIEFRIELSTNYNSDIILFNYNLANDYQLYIFLNSSNQINVQLNGQIQQFSLISAEIIHFSIGVIHKLEKNYNYFQLCFLQISNDEVIKKVFPVNEFSYSDSQKPFKSGKGKLWLGSSVNQFGKDQFVKLYIFRLYLGFFYDDQGIVDPLCKFYLNDRCIICNKGYFLSIDHICVQNCSASVFLTEYVESHNQCIRSCHTTCSTCLNDSPTICLICSGNRINPPNCNCPPKYFEDNVSPNCRCINQTYQEYFQDIPTQSGYIRGDCSVSSENVITFGIPYNSIPTVEIALQGHEYYFHKGQAAVVKISTKDITVNGFKVSFQCLYSPQQYYVQWISSIGKNKFNVIGYIIPQNTGSLQVVLPPPQLIQNQYYTMYPHFRGFQILNYGYGQGQNYINNQNTTTNSTMSTYSFNCGAQFDVIGLLQTNYISYFYRNFSQIAEIPIQNMPKSISSFNIITETDSDDSSNFNILHMHRSPKVYKLQNSYKTSRIAGYLLFTAFQCQDPNNFCDFYKSYVTSCSLEFSICQCNEEGFFLNSTNECSSCDINCKTCQQTSAYCTSCAQFWYLDSTVNQCFQCDQSCYSCDGQQYNQCMSCGENKQLTSDNQCVCKIGYYKDDINCLQCDKSCLDCVNPTQCLNCPFDRYLDTNSKLCICFDGYYETQDQACQLCNSQCLTCQDWNNCLTCVTGKTVLDGRCICAQGYYKYGQECLPCNDGKGLFYIECKIINCSDGIWSPYEECDDGNQIANDGCTNCLIDTDYKCINRMRQKSLCYKCQENCQDCAYDKQKINCLQCKDRYFLSQNNCVKCSQLCQTCEQMSTKCLTCLIQDEVPDHSQSCKGCDMGYYLDKNQCKPSCGDGFQAISENCDDGNSISGDGCGLNCNIDQNYQCSTFNGLSICRRLTKPYLLVNQIIQKSSSIHIIEIQSSELVQVDNLTLQMKSDQESLYETFNYFPISSNTTEDFIILQINITIEFNTTIPETQLTLQVDGDIHNKDLLQLDPNYLQFQFKNVMVLSQSQNTSSSQISNQASGQMIVTLIINCFSILLSGSDQFALMLRVNNIISYIKFMDISFAPNLLQLILSLEEFNVIDKLNVINTFNNMDVGPKIEFEYIDPGYLFKRYQVNANIIGNIMPFVLNIISGYLFVLLLQSQLFIINRILQSSIKTISTFNQIYYKILSFYQIYALKLINQFKNKGIEQLTEASQYKIIFAVSIQLKVQKFDGFQSIFRLFITLFFLVFYLRFTYNKLNQNDINLRFKGVKLFTILFNLNPLVYILSIVFLDQFTLCQLNLIQLLSISMIGVIIYFPYKKMQFNIQILIEDTCFVLLFSSFIIFIYNPQQVDYILLGFIQSGFVIIMLTSNIVIQLHSNFLYILQLYSKYQMKMQKQRSRVMKDQLEIINLTLK